MSSKELDMVGAWFEAGTRKNILLRWLFTEWCNYRCHYCPQTHERYATKEDGYTAHAFDNHPVDKWLASFDHHFSGGAVSLVLTGGEPLIDRKNMGVVLKHFTECQYVTHIRIDTNMSFQTSWYSDLKKEKISLMCTFHPTQIKEEKFVRNLDMVLQEGFTVGMVNYVMDAVNADKFVAFRDLLWTRGIPAQPNPLFGSKGKYAPVDIEIMRANLPPRDFELRSQNESPLGKECLFPAVAYEMDSAGRVQVGCHGECSKSFFEDTLPESPSLFSACPDTVCVCLDKYSFLKDFARNVSSNPFRLYTEELVVLQSANQKTSQRSKS